MKRNGKFGPKADFSTRLGHLFSILMARFYSMRLAFED
jgi:hypothetical protein